jgi:hypothetical protein
LRRLPNLAAEVLVFQESTLDSVVSTDPFLKQIKYSVIRQKDAPSAGSMRIFFGENMVATLEKARRVC